MVSANVTGELRHPSARRLFLSLSSVGPPHDTLKWPHKGKQDAHDRPARTGRNDGSEEPKWDGTLLLPGTVRLERDLISCHISDVKSP